MRLLTFIGSDTVSDGESLLRYTSPIDWRYWCHPVLEIGGDCLSGDITLTIELGVDHNMMAAKAVHTIHMEQNTKLPRQWAIDTDILQQRYPLLPYLRLKAETQHGLERAYIAVLSQGGAACAF